MWGEYPVCKDTGFVAGSAGNLFAVPRRAFSNPHDKRHCPVCAEIKRLRTSNDACEEAIRAKNRLLDVKTELLDHQNEIIANDAKRINELERALSANRDISEGFMADYNAKVKYSAGLEVALREIRCLAEVQLSPGGVERVYNIADRALKGETGA